MTDQEREFMVAQVAKAVDGYADYENVGGEPGRPVLEIFPHQAELKEYLRSEGLIQFWGMSPGLSQTTGKQKSYQLLGGRSNLAWCSDPDCDRVIVDVPVSMYLDKGRLGEIAMHPDCFQRNIKEGFISMG